MFISWASPMLFESTLKEPSMRKSLLAAAAASLVLVLGMGSAQAQAQAPWPTFSGAPAAQQPTKAGLSAYPPIITTVQPTPGIIYNPPPLMAPTTRSGLTPVQPIITTAQPAPPTVGPLCVPENVLMADGVRSGPVPCTPYSGPGNVTSSPGFFQPGPIILTAEPGPSPGPNTRLPVRLPPIIDPCADNPSATRSCLNPGEAAEVYVPSTYSGRPIGEERPPSFDLPIAKFGRLVPLSAQNTKGGTLPGLMPTTMPAPAPIPMPYTPGAPLQ